MPMPDPKHYKDIADRYWESADILVGTVHEASAFAAYHAFESIGAAWLRHLGRTVPQKHASKLRDFASQSKRRLRASLAIGELALLLQGLRNALLYPFLSNAGYRVPRQALTPAEARRLVSRVGGIIRQVSNNL